MVARAWKFLDAAAVSPITEVRWPLPEPGAPGAWVAEPRGLGALDGVYACRRGDLPCWLRAELWEVELDGPVTELAQRIEAPRGRLVRRVFRWDEALTREFAERCARRTRDLCADRLEALGHPAEAAQLRGCASLTALQQVALPPGKPGEVDQLLGYPVDAAGCAVAGLGLAAGLVAATAAEAAGAQLGRLEERALQAPWLSERLGL